MTDIATLEPTEVTAGDTWQWQKSLADYPAGTWTLKYYFRGRVGDFEATAAASGLDHLVTIAKATTAGYKAGEYQWISVVNDATTRYTVERGLVLVKPDPSKTGAGFETRGHARIVLDAIEAVLESRATKDQEEYTIGSRSLKRTPLADLMKLRDRYKAMTLAEEGKVAGKVVARL